MRIGVGGGKPSTWWGLWVRGTVSVVVDGPRGPGSGREAGFEDCVGEVEEDGEVQEVE